MAAREAGRDRVGPEDWWADIDHDVLGCLEAAGPVAVDAVAVRLGISERAATSLVAMLAGQGKVHIRLVERREEPAGSAVAAGDEPGQRARAEATGVSALMVREGWHLWVEMQQAVLGAAREQQGALIRWQALWAEMMVHPVRSYLRALEAGATAARRALVLAGASARALGEAVDRLQTAARPTVRRAA